MRTGRHQYRPMQRLTEPLVRDNGVLREASWSEALDRVTAGFQRALDDGGGKSIGMFSCSKSTNEMNFIAQKLARVVVIELDTLPRWSVWPQCSERVAERRRTVRRRPPTSS